MQNDAGRMIEMARRFGSHFQTILFFIVVLAGFGSWRSHVPSPIWSFTAESWKAADGIFRTDSRWLGGDGAGSVDLGNGRVLWLFGDSLIEPSGRHGRAKAVMVRNSVAIQQGYDPTRASLHFFWGQRDGNPFDFFEHDHDGNWFWPGQGIRLGERLLLFLMEIRLRSDGFFDAAGWKAVWVDNPDQVPSEWRLFRLNGPRDRLGVIAGSAAVLRDGEYVYAYGAKSAENHPVYLVRWTIPALQRGDLSAPQWFDGDRRVWVGQKEFMEKPTPVFSGGQVEFSVHFDSVKRQYLQIQTMSFWDGDIVARWGMGKTGPWSPPVSLFHPPESGRKGLVVYAGKAHPELSGADLIMTYAVNTFESEKVIENEDIYYPRFVKLSWRDKSD